MAYSQDLVQRFQQWYTDTHGVTIAYNVAERELKELAEFMRIVLKQEDKLDEKPATNKR